jgi:hypothetical protein
MGATACIKLFLSAIPNYRANYLNVGCFFEDGEKK